jgi:hypothetical protein
MSSTVLVPKKNYPSTAWEQWLSRAVLDKCLVTIQFWSTGTLPVERDKITALQESMRGNEQLPAEIVLPKAFKNLSGKRDSARCQAYN